MTVEEFRREVKSSHTEFVRGCFAANKVSIREYDIWSVQPKLRVFIEAEV
jgi:hypothetical protein